MKKAEQLDLNYGNHMLAAIPTRVYSFDLHDTVNIGNNNYPPSNKLIYKYNGGDYYNPHGRTNGSLRKFLAKMFYSRQFETMHSQKNTMLCWDTFK